MQEMPVCSMKIMEGLHVRLQNENAKLSKKNRLAAKGEAYDSRQILHRDSRQVARTRTIPYTICVWVVDLYFLPVCCRVIRCQRYANRVAAKRIVTPMAAVDRGPANEFVRFVL